MFTMVRILFSPIQVPCMKGRYHKKPKKPSFYENYTIIPQMKILIVEPAKLYQQIIGKVFKDNSCDYTVVGTAELALSVIKDNKYDFVCASMQLPDMTGSQLTRRIRTLNNGRTVPVALLTSTTDVNKMESAYAEGVTEVFHKHNLNGLFSYIAQLVSSYALEQPINGRILYIEDDSATAAVTMAMLEHYSVSVDHYTSGDKALQAFAENDYDLVLTDIVLEGSITGQELVRLVRNHQGGKATTPVLVVSSHQEASLKIELFRTGANDYISKPVLSEELWARVKNLILNRQLLRRIEVQQRHLESMATTDQLTGLYNRHYLADIGPRKISEARRHQFPLSLIIADVDKFKLINDNHGHNTGDKVLREIGQLLVQSCRNEDCATRFGGEEFVLILPHCHLEDAVSKAEKLRIAVSQLMPAGLHVTSSFGVSTLDLAGNESFSDLFDAADRAVYTAKGDGRNCVRQESCVEGGKQAKTC